MGRVLRNQQSCALTDGQAEYEAGRCNTGLMVAGVAAAESLKHQAARMAELVSVLRLSPEV